MAHGVNTRGVTFGRKVQVCRGQIARFKLYKCMSVHTFVPPIYSAAVCIGKPEAILGAARACISHALGSHRKQTRREQRNKQQVHVYT